MGGEGGRLARAAAAAERRGEERTGEETHGPTLQSRPHAERSYVRSGLVEQRFLLLVELAQGLRQAQAEAHQELGPGADATPWHRSGGRAIRGQ